MPYFRISHKLRNKKRMTRDRSTFFWHSEKNNICFKNNERAYKYKFLTIGKCIQRVGFSWSTYELGVLTVIDRIDKVKYKLKTRREERYCRLRSVLFGFSTFFPGRGLIYSAVSGARWLHFEPREVFGFIYTFLISIYETRTVLLSGEHTKQNGVFSYKSRRVNVARRRCRSLCHVT